MDVFGLGVRTVFDNISPSVLDYWYNCLKGWRAQTNTYSYGSK
nr:MAG TPA: hypothetical protein [Caudoviricetes sp.]